MTNDTMEHTYKEEMKCRLLEVIGKVKEQIYQHVDTGMLRGETEEWMASWQEWILLLESHTTSHRKSCDS